MCYRGVGKGISVLFDRAGQLFGVLEQVAVCELELSEGGIKGDWGFLLKCRCEFLSYACAVGWVIHVFHDEGGVLGWNW